MNNKLINTKWFLYLTEFFAGMSVMAVELGASRLMAPYFSSSQIVWTVIIGVIMIAMAVGNVWGGSMADKSKSPDRLYRRVIIAAIWIALIPFVGRWMIAGISFLLATFITKNFLVWAAFAACLLIFAFPCVLLGTVTPSLTKFTVDNLDDTGKTVGRLNALNTIGSIIGTFVPTFVTIPAVGTAATFLIFSGVLAAIGLAYFIFERKKTIAGNTNTEVFCTNADTLVQTFDESRAKLTNARYAEIMATVAQRLTEYTGGGKILTDDKAPVELLGMRVLDELIAGELSYYKSNFSMDNIIGMLGT